LHQRHDSALVVIDSLASFLPAHSENSAGGLLECLTPLQRLTTLGMAVLLPHHPRKGKTVAGQAARGSGALPGFVDIIIEMGYYAHPDDQDRRRRLVAFSRHSDTPRHLLIELPADGTDYVVLPSGPEDTLGDGWPAVASALSQAYTKLTRQEILDQWPPDYPKPDRTTLWRWLSRAATQGVVCQEGTGRPRDPFRYWLPEREAMMCPEGASAEALQAWNDRCIAEMFAGTQWTEPAIEGQEAAPSAGESPRPVSRVAVPEAKVSPPEPVPLPAPMPEAVAPASPPPGKSPPVVSHPVAAEAPIRLPYPFNTMNPADVPAEVWQQASAGRENTL
jgi:hypothetical protein